MPRKATGGKNGRPLKSASKKLTAIQMKYVELTIDIPGKSQTFYAGRLGVTRAAVSKWESDPVIQREKQMLPLRKAVRKFSDQRKREEANQRAIRDEEFARLKRDRELNIKVWVENNWTAPIALPGRKTIIKTKEKYAEAMIKNNLYPVDHIAETARRGKRKGFR